MKQIIAHMHALLRRIVPLSILAVLALCILIPATASAASTAAPPKCAQADTHCVITFGDTIITDRQKALTTLSGKVTAQLTAQHITSDQANTLQADITTNQNGLTALKTKLDLETDAKAAREDVRNVYAQFRIYAVVLPHDYRLLHIDLLIHLDAKLKSLEPQIQQSISAAPASKQGQLNTLFTDYKTQLTNAESQIDATQTDFSALTVTNFNTNHAAFETALANLRQAEQTAHNDLHQAVKDYHQIEQLLKKK